MPIKLILLLARNDLRILLRFDFRYLNYLIWFSISADKFSSAPKIPRLVTQAGTDAGCTDLTKGDTAAQGASHGPNSRDPEIKYNWPRLVGNPKGKVS